MNALLIVEWPQRLSLPLLDAWRVTLAHRNDGGRLATLKQPSAADDTAATDS